ncbi:MAG: hypothetical protein WCK75_01580 [Elusimicrobiota bacterium]
MKTKITGLTRILQFRMIPLDKSVEQNYSAGFPAKRAEGQALCATGPTGCIPPEGRPLYGRKTSTEVFRLILQSALVLFSAAPLAAQRQKNAAADSKLLNYIRGNTADPACGVCLNSARGYFENITRKNMLRLTDGMVKVQGGEYKIGSEKGKGEPDEMPRHSVWLDPFYMFYSGDSIFNSKTISLVYSGIPGVFRGIPGSSGDSIFNSKTISLFPAIAAYQFPKNNRIPLIIRLSLAGFYIKTSRC